MSESPPAGGNGEKAVVYPSRMNPFLGRNFVAMDPLEWLVRLCDHIPDPGQHRTLFYGGYSSRPPPVPEILRVAEEGDGWGVPAQWEPA